MRFQRLTIVLGALLAVCAAPIAAQAPSSELPSAPGPGWTFTPGVAIGIVHDSNTILRATEGSSEGVPDQLWNVEPSGALDYLGKYTTFAGSYNGNIRRYATLDALNGYDQRGALALTRRATKFVTLRLSDTYARLPTTDELDLPGVVPFTRVGSRINTLTGGIEARLAPRTKLAATYTGTWTHFDQQNNLILRGANVHALGTELTRALTERISMGAEFEYRIADLDEGLHQFRFQDAGGTLHYTAGPHTGLDAAGGVAHVTDRADGSSSTGPFVRLGLTHQTARAVLGVSYQRLYVPSVGFAGSNRSQQLRGYAHAPLARRLYVDGSLAWRRSDPLLANVLQIQSIVASSSIGYEYARWLRFEGFYRFSHQDTQVAGGEVVRHRAGIRAVFSQPVRIQ